MRNVNELQRMLQFKAKKAELNYERKKIMDDDAWDVFEKRTEGITKEEISKMDGIEIIKINTIDDKTAIISLPDFEDEATIVEYLRGMMVFLKEIDEFNEALDKSMDQLSKIMEEGQKELKELTEASGDENLINLMRKSLNDAVVKAGDNTVKAEQLKRSAEAFEDTFNLQRIIDMYKKIGTENLEIDAKRNAADVYKRYTKAAKALGVSFDLSIIADFEKRFLPEEYHDLNNLFIFACMRYISRLTVTRGAQKSTDGFFASQFCTNVYMFTQNSLPEEEHAKFMAGAKNLLDLLR